MKLDLGRLFNSEFFALATDAEFRAGLVLWGRAFHQVPAGSLPDDERVLAALAGYGRDLKKWRKVCAMALRGWIKCRDGRLYHRTVAEIVEQAWEERLRYKDAQVSANARKERERAERRHMFEVLRACGQVPSWDTPTSRLRELVGERHGATGHGEAPVTSDDPGRPGHTPVTDLSRVTSCEESRTCHGPVTAKKGRGRSKNPPYSPPLPTGTVTGGEAVASRAAPSPEVGDAPSGQEGNPEEPLPRAPQGPSAPLRQPAGAPAGPAPSEAEMLALIDDHLAQARARPAELPRTPRQRPGDAPTPGTAAAAEPGVNGARSMKRPTAYEVEEYARSIGFRLDGSEFVDFYATKGWMVGKSPMRDWKAAVRTWKHKHDRDTKAERNDYANWERW
jgi:hypothetical protein